MIRSSYGGCSGTSGVVSLVPGWRVLPSRLACCLWILAGLLCLSGCGSRSDLGQVSGVVTLDGEPLPDAFVEFVPKGPGSTSYGKTNASGYYEMMFSMSAKGASLGESTVRITTRDLYLDEQGREKWTKEKVPPRYRIKSELIADVKPGKNKFDFPLTLKP